MDLPVCGVEIERPPDRRYCSAVLFFERRWSQFIKKRL